MANIRALKHEDLPTVASLLRTYLPGWPRGEDSFLKHLAEVLIEHPWADEELPSLVATTDAGEVIGFIGSHVRRFRLDDRILRGVCTSNLVVDAEHRGTAAGVLLMRRMLSGPQDFSYADQATLPVVRMWRLSGGRMDHARAYDWMLVLRPLRWLSGAIATAARQRSIRREAFPVGGFPFQMAGSRLVRRAYPAHPGPSPDVTGEDATSATIVENLPAITKGVRLRVEHDKAFLDHLFAQMETMRGPLVRRIVRRAGEPIGWYAYLSRPHFRGFEASGRGLRASRVMHLAASPAEAEPVLQELMAHARTQGTAVLVGRMEPHLHWALRRQLAVLGFARQPTIHTPDPEIDALLMRSSSLLTQLDGEWLALP